MSEGGDNFNDCPKAENDSLEEEKGDFENFYFPGDMVFEMLNFCDLETKERCSRCCREWNFIFNKFSKPSFKQIKSVISKGKYTTSVLLHRRYLFSFCFWDLEPLFLIVEKCRDIRDFIIIFHLEFPERKSFFNSEKSIIPLLKRILLRKNLDFLKFICFNFVCGFEEFKFSDFLKDYMKNHDYHSEFNSRFFRLFSFENDQEILKKNEEIGNYLKEKKLKIQLDFNVCSSLMESAFETKREDIIIFFLQFLFPKTCNISSECKRCDLILKMNVFQESCFNNYTEVIDSTQNCKKMKEKIFNEGLVKACLKNRLDLVKKLSFDKRCNFSFNLNKPIRTAKRLKYYKLVDFILKKKIINQEFFEN